MTPLACKPGAIKHSPNHRQLILEALERTGAVIIHAAQELGVNRETLRRWIIRLDLYPDVRRIRYETQTRPITPPRVF